MSELASLSGRIDVHHHVLPPALLAALDRHGIIDMAGGPVPKWNPRMSLGILEEHDIQTAITSVSAPGVRFAGGAEAASLARACNEFAADMAVRHPGRFGSFAILPMPFTAAACAEAVHALDVLKAAGVVLLGSVDGIFLGDPRFEELMAELDRRSAIVFIHPNLHPSSEQLGLDMPGFLMEFLCDTTRASLNLILTGTLERYPRIRWILAHAGGFLPYAAWRLSLANMMPKFAKQAPQGVLTYMRRFYFDTALSPSPYAMAALGQLVDHSHILFGSDFPFAPAPVTAMQVNGVETLSFWNAQQKTAVFRSNALALFPQFAKAHEAPAALATHHRQTLKQRLRGAVRLSVLNTVDRIRNR
ncbi:amidohydrolase family protein [Niveispirillum sp.]|uniref:amidohydrolase family protein n=1 Tax=Niveispirillum sp. TaxID=1917217 RepID=UPI001B4BFB15|nr:amidohydrolase family protein [Niveispirillum sp.]MBP7338627.1 amidohydrolase [Niveispirillum sp.]